eukprot:NODE_1527_length_1473_cov_12.452452_g1447_i0.p1 GENE.NODE_1527_length_1473_cov_12.452452_g1447_i0~~NODE_1527_length_1473_cov_12.452452_g1447_i0.p1  ORF type:complete len:233 (-),score=75.46 NODE_1527_length_1473_cov_12.452452_g1447_i0:82-780(-)
MHGDAEQTEKAELLRLGGLSADEITIIQGVLDMPDRLAKDSMIPLSDTFMLPAETVLDMPTLQDLITTGHSRVPIYQGDKHNIRGILLTKKLMLVSPDAKTCLADLDLISPPVCISPELPLLDALHVFQENRSHMAVVTNQPEVVLGAIRDGTPIPPDVYLAGVLCLEDIFEHIIGEHISDEFDLNDVQKRQQTVLKILAKAKKTNAAIRSASNNSQIALPMENDEVRLLSS